MKKLIIIISCCVLLLFSSTPLFAYPMQIPAAGIVERELEREYEQRPFELIDNIPAIQIDIPEERLDFPEGKKVWIRNVEISGNDCLDTALITTWIEGSFDRELSIQDIYCLCSLIDQCYAQQGYFLSRAYPPPQTIDNGVLKIEIIEGRLGNVVVQGNCHYSEAFIRSYFRCMLNQPLHYNQFLRALLLLNENSDLVVGAIFQKGEEFGTADLILNVSDGRPIHLYLNGNNYGRDITTGTRVGGRLDWGNFLTYGDTLSIAEVVGFPLDALYFNDITYTVPINRNGTSIEVGYLFSQFEVDELREFNPNGKSEIATIMINHALYRNRTLSVDGFSYFDFKQIENRADNFQNTFDKLRVLTFGTSLDRFNPLCSRDLLTVQFGVGIPNFLGGLKAVDPNSSSFYGGGRFVKLNADYDRLQYLPRDCFFYFHASGQWSPDSLTLPEVIYIGGQDTVRGFPLAVAIGDSGFYINGELRFPPPFLANKDFFMCDKTWKEIVQLGVFWDNGGVNKHNGYSKYLSGAGFGIRINGPYTLTCSLDLGFPLNHRNESTDPFVYIKVTAQPF